MLLYTATIAPWGIIPSPWTQSGVVELCWECTCVGLRLFSKVLWFPLARLKEMSSEAHVAAHGGCLRSLCQDLVAFGGSSRW